MIDEEGRQSALFNRLATAKENEYPNVLADIIRSAYHDAFAIIGNNPNDVTDRELVDAFRVYQPETQRNRMIILFRGLCQEAELLAGGPPETRTRQRTGTSTKPSLSHSNGTRKLQSEPKDTPFQSESDQVSPPQASHSTKGTPITSTQEYVIMQGVLNKLPFAEKAWTQAQRTKWLKAVAANIDMLFELEDPSTEVEIEEDMYRP